MTERKRLASRSILFLTTALLAAPLPAQYSTPVRDVENPARTPYWASVTINISQGFAGVLNSPIAAVTEGQRLVIEQVSVRCASPSGNPIVRANIGVTERTSASSSTTRPFDIPLNFQGTDPFSGPTWVGGISSRMYSDAGLGGGGSSVTGGLIRANGTGTGFCNFAISGYTLSI